MSPSEQTTSDEWFSEFIAKLEKSKARRRRLWRERVVLPVKDELARDYDEKTEQQRRIIRVERERWQAEMGRIA